MTTADSGASVTHQWDSDPLSATGIFWCAICGLVTNTRNTNVPCLTAPKTDYTTSAES